MTKGTSLPSGTLEPKGEDLRPPVLCRTPQEGKPADMLPYAACLGIARPTTCETEDLGFDAPVPYQLLRRIIKL